MRLQNTGDGQKTLQASMLVGEGRGRKIPCKQDIRMAGSFSATKSETRKQGVSSFQILR